MAIDRTIGAFVEPVVALVIVAEVCILGAGVFSRYVLHNALPWTDELAAYLFLWLTMLGAVVAYRRDEHMRMSALFRVVSVPVRETLEIVSAAVIAMFSVMLIPASFKYYDLETIDFSPALNLPRSYEVIAIMAGLVLLLALAVLRLVDGNPRRSIPVAVVAAVTAFAALHFHGALTSLGNVNLVVFFVIVVGACVAIGVPIAFAFGFGTVSYLALATTSPLSTVVGRMSEGIGNLVLLAIPLFVLLGVLIEAAGISRRLVDALASLVGHFKGGLNIVLVAAMYLVSGISGSKAADMAAVAPVLFPEMEKRGQKRPEMIALLSTSGAMAETIPPSFVLIMIGTVAGLSIKDLFTAGLLPALVASICLIVVALFRSRNERTDLVKRPSARAIGRAFLVASPGLVLPFVIRFFVMNGVATATEVSTIGIVYTLLVGVFVYREFKWRRAYPMLIETASLSGAIMLIIATATAMAWALTQSGFAQQLATLLSHAGGPAGFLALSIVLFIVLGSVLEGAPAIVLFGPLLFPIALQIGVNPIHYAIVVILAMGVGLFAPPLGVGYYGACAIGKCEPDAAVKPMLPYMCALIVALIIVAAVPWLSIGFLKG